MKITTFYERRRQTKSVNFKDRRLGERRKGGSLVKEEQRRLASQTRRLDRELFRIPVCVQAGSQSFSGYTENISPEGMMIHADMEMRPGNAVSLAFTFGDRVCFLNIAGQTVFSILSENGQSPLRATGIRFAGIRPFEQKILVDSVRELKQCSRTLEKSLLTIHIAPDRVARAARLVDGEEPRERENLPTIGLGRRSSTRVDQPIDMTVILKNHRGKTTLTFAGRTRDLARKGISFQMERRLPDFGTGMVMLKIPGALEPVKARIKLRWREDKRHIYGFELVKIQDPNWINWWRDQDGHQSAMRDRRLDVDRRRDTAEMHLPPPAGDRRTGSRRASNIWHAGREDTKQDHSGLASLDMIPKLSDGGYSVEAARLRREWLRKKTGVDFRHLGVFSGDPEEMRGNIENLIGVAQVPIGVAGPLKINGEHAKGKFYVPLATTEGVLVISYTLGMTLVSRAGGVNAKVLKDEMHISPIFQFESMSSALKFVEWVNRNYDIIKREAESTSRYGKLNRVEPCVLNRNVLLKFCYDTGDAMGMNMINIATEKACRLIASAVRPEKYYIRSNFSSDKKITAHNYVHGKGKTVIADVTIRRRDIERLHSTPEEMQAYAETVLQASTYAGMIGMNGQVANPIAALFIAFGQDVANVANSFVGVTTFKVNRQGDLYVSLYLPSLILGTIGGGTRLGTQQECLRLVGCNGKGKSKKLAEIVAATALAGEIAICLSIANGSFVDSHALFGRKGTS